MKQFYAWISLLLSIIVCKLSQCSAKPTYYDLDSYENSFDRRSYDSSSSSTSSGNSYTLTYGKPLSGDNLDKLNTGYYYVDNGYIAPVPSSSANQRSLSAYNDDVLSDGYRVAPVARLRRTRTKRKKLFVPNFFG